LTITGVMIDYQYFENNTNTARWFFLEINYLSIIIIYLVLFLNTLLL
jgi:hypothetical protein